MEILWYCSRMSTDMFKKQLSLLVQSGYIRDDGRLHEEKPGLSSLSTWHTCSVREIGPNGTNSDGDVARFRESSFSKTLISGPQISCQSSVLHRHRIREKAVPYKSTTCQSHAHTVLMTQEGKQSLADACVTPPTWQRVLHLIAFPPLDY